MSPEQALGEPTDWRSDLWALAVLAFQCLTGKLPFFHEALGGLLTQILHEPIPSIREANPQLPKAVEDWWHRAAEREPARRFQTAHEMSDALAAALGVSERLAVPELVPCSEALSVDLSDVEEASGSAAEFVARLGSDAPVAMNTGELVTRFRRRVRSRSAWTWGVALAGLSALVALGWFAQTTSLFRAPTSPAVLAPAPAMVAPAPPAPRPTVAPVQDAGAAEQAAGTGSPEAGVEADAGPSPAEPRNGVRPADVWPTPRAPDMPSLERPNGDPPRPRAPVRRRSWRPLQEPGTRDYGI
jgi:serine/threonine-protein kinase